MSDRTRGTRGGTCNRSTCTTTGADWHNIATDAWYCRSCARLINRLNRGERDAPFCRFVAEGAAA